MIKCNLEMCTNYNNGICTLNEITIDKYYDNELGYFIGGSCKDLKFKQSYLDDKSERTFKLMKISDDFYYAIRTSVFNNVDVEYVLCKYPNIKVLIVDNLIKQGTKASDRFWIYTFENNDIKTIYTCDKYNKLITKEMLKFTCDYIRESKNYGCLTSVQYKMIMKGIDL